MTTLDYFRGLYRVQRAMRRGHIVAAIYAAWHSTRRVPF